MPAQPKPEEAPRLRDAMPRPLLLLFVVLGVIVIGATAVALVAPGTVERQAVEARRPPPKGDLSHDVGRIFPAPLPSVVSTIDEQCPAAAGARPIGGPSAVERGRQILRQICRLEKGGVGPEIQTAIEGIRGVRIRTADFGLTGVDSTVDLKTRTIYLNLRFVLSKVEPSAVAPVVLHEAWHLAHASEPITAAQELAARTVEVAACRELIATQEWPRWCKDALAIVNLPRAKALSLLERAGFPH